MSVLAFGEVLWDVYPDQSTLGGAPFNFAAHLARLGTRSCLVSAVGGDELGKKTREALRRMGVDDRYTVTAEEPTGVCRVTVSDAGAPSYELLRDTAYDFIRLTEEQYGEISGEGHRAICFGTLAQRGEVSRETLRRLLRENRFEQVLFDVNIRQSFYSREILERGLFACTMLKCSREEAGVFRELGLVKAERAAFDDERAYLAALCGELAGGFGIGTILMTLDKEGAMVYDGASGRATLSQRPEGRAVSAVGAGDSFTACYLHFTLLGRPLEECLRKAVILSDYVVGQLDSVPDYPPELLVKLQ